MTEQTVDMGGFRVRSAEELPDDEYSDFVLDLVELGLVMKPGERADFPHIVRVKNAGVSV